ncbi:MAG: protein kinase [Terriglobia bacterium]|jgi:serine/threonine-protein kinase
MKKIGRYNIISELGRGAMGIVYKASDPTIGREVALKVLSLSASAEEGTNSAQEMFMREVRAAGRLAHPSIVTIHDAFDDAENQTSCIVMEMVPGVTLEKILNSGSPLTTEQILILVRQVVEGLDYAHRHQVIHRDLKPANILVTEDGRAKITDFGIAKVLAQQGVARTVGIMGTPSYMSPEQVKGGEIDARTDIFSLGIMIFTMLTGKKPFAGNTAAVMFQIVYEEPPATSSLNAQLTPAHDYVVSKCLAKDRDRRYSSARELLGDLDDLQQGRPPRTQAMASELAAAQLGPAGAPGPDQTLAMPIPSLIKAASQQPAPRPAPPPATPGKAGGPVMPPPTDRTMAMSIPGLMKAASQQPAPRPAAPAPPSAPPQRAAAPPKPAAGSPGAPAQGGGPAAPPTMDRTMAMSIPGLMKGASQPPSPRVVSAPLPVPVQPPKPVIPPPATPARAPQGRPLTGQTLPMRVPDLSALSSTPPSSPRAAPVPPAPPESSLSEQRLPKYVPDLSTTSQASGPLPMPLAPFPQPVDESAVEPAETPGAVSTAPKSKFIPAVVGGVAVVVLVVATWGYWKFHSAKIAPSPPPSVAVQTPPAIPPPITSTVATPTPSPASTVEQANPPVSATPEAAKKTVVHKPKQAIVPHPAAPAPTPPPAQPAPVVAAPPPQPSPSQPSPEDIAKAEAARLAKIPRIVKVLCNFGLKEATFVFSAGGNTLFEEPLKGKKVKGGFLGIKGSYQGTFSHTITVPAGMSEVSIRVIARDGATDITKAIKMPAPGGFVPTLAVEVDNEHLSLNWQSSAAAK